MNFCFLAAAALLLALSLATEDSPEVHDISGTPLLSATSPCGPRLMPSPQVWRRSRWSSWSRQEVPTMTRADVTAPPPFAHHRHGPAPPPSSARDHEPHHIAGHDPSPHPRRRPHGWAALHRERDAAVSPCSFADKSLLSHPAPSQTSRCCLGTTWM